MENKGYKKGKAGVSLPATSVACANVADVFSATVVCA